MAVLEEFARRVLNVDRELTALDYFEVLQRLTPVEREALNLACDAEEPRERFVNAVCDRGPFELFD
jgi:hypothetical protein